ncbi:MAG: hypothetical protein H7Z43_05545 [Clostridia bacterium]|nr:hypothetical protein [Deltaproteobacteria bacterium]
MLRFALMLVLATPVDVSYSGPKDGHAVNDYHPQSWTEGSVAWTARDTHLMSSATAEDATASGLPLGTKVTVGARSSELTRNADRVDYWYEVTTVAAVKGFVFGADLTPAAFEADLDDDGRKEMATVSWTPEFQLRVRYSDKGILKELDVKPAGQTCARFGGVAHAELVSKKEAGRTLLRLTTNSDECPGTADLLVSFVGSEPRLAFETTDTNQPPKAATHALEFSKDRLQLLQTTSDTTKPGSETTMRSNYLLKKGVYLKQTEPGSPGPHRR